MRQGVKIQEEINKLVSRLRPNASEQFKVDMQEYFKKLSGASFRGGNENATQVRQKIMKKVTNKADSKTVYQCQETIYKIMGANSINKKGEILKMLLKVSDLSETKNYSRIFDVDEKVEELNVTSASGVRDMNRSNNSFISNIASSNVYQVGGTSMNATGNTNIFMKPRRTANLQELLAMRNRGSSEQGISQIDIIRQITYVMQNIESNLIKHTDRDTFQLQPNINVSQTVKSIVSQLCEIGWLYQKIISSLKDSGCIEKALIVAVQEEMNEYYRWLAVIESSIKLGNISLRKLVKWSYEPMQKLKWITIILQAIQPYSGSQIISLINSYRPHGSGKINQLLNRLLAHMIQPLLQFIHNWMYKGELVDQYEEFFVQEKKKFNQVVQWFEKFRLVQTNIPNILDKDSAVMIFNAGRTIHFLKNKCKCNYSIPIPFINPSKILNYDICESSNILSPEFRKWLTSVYEDLSERLVAEMKQRYNLKYHLGSMKHFYLMGKGDFIQQLVDTLKEQMSKPKHLVYQHTLDGYISDAVSKSFQDFRIDLQPENRKMEVQQDKNAQISRVEEHTQKNIMLKGSKISVQNKKQKEKQINFYNSYRANILDRLLAKKVDFADNAWDAFNFQYSMDKIEPIYSILSPDLVENYQRIFQFLWKIKRIQQILKDIWVIHQKQYPKTQQNKNFRQFSRLLHRCHIIRCSMSHFVNTFYGYLMIAIESAWDKFWLSLQKSQSLDEIIKQHRTLHVELAGITFSSLNKKNLRDSLLNVFKSIEQFKTLQQKLLNEYSDFYEKMRNYDNRKKIMVRGILNLEDHELEIPSFDEEEVAKRLQEIHQVYDKCFKIFYENLKKEGEETSVLVFRLDFSEYFAMKEIEDRK